MTTITCPNKVVEGGLITRVMREEVFGPGRGATSSEHEKYARRMIEEGTGVPCSKTDTRINLETNQLKDIACPNKRADGFDYTEDFDGKQVIRGKTVYINLKCVVGKGGAQTRTLREVYWFVKGQLNVLLTQKDQYFANILDGDESARCMRMFNNSLDNPKFQEVRKYVYVGDLKGYFDWLNSVVVCE